MMKEVKEILEGNREVIRAAKRSLEDLADQYGIHSEAYRQARQEYVQTVRELLPYSDPITVAAILAGWENVEEFRKNLYSGSRQHAHV